VKYSTPVLEVIEVRADWITATCSPGPGAQSLRNKAMEWEEGAEMLGDKPQPWRGMGYRGYKCGQFRWGEGKEGVMVQVNGFAAGELALTLAHASEHWSRVDYCVTCFDNYQASSPTHEYAEQLESEVLSGRETAKVTSIVTIGAGSSLYIGSRASGRYLRCYDKHAESPSEYVDGTWRWEVEYKRELSELMRSRTVDGWATQGAIRDLVRAEFRRHKLEVPWQPDDAAAVPMADKRLRDVETTLLWLEKQVGPAARWVASQRDWDSIMTALRGPTGSEQEE
jgi:Replication initiation factor